MPSVGFLLLGMSGSSAEVAVERASQLEAALGAGLSGVWVEQDADLPLDSTFTPCGLELGPAPLAQLVNPVPELYLWPAGDGSVGVAGPHLPPTGLGEGEGEWYGSVLTGAALGGGVCPLKFICI